MQDSSGKWVICCVKGCDRPILSIGLCVNHYRRNRKYGSPVASAIHSGAYRGLSPEARFWKQTLKQDGDGCWNWLTGCDMDGYGAFAGEFDGVLYRRAHRYSYALHFGHPPVGMHVCHKCDNPKCVRPDHLFIGSPLENMTDKMTKGRHVVPFGADHHWAVLTEAQARAILIDARPYNQLANEYGVSPATIGDIKSRYSWPHLGKEKGAKAPRVSPRKGVSDRVTPEIVRDIRTSTMSGLDLAARYGISPQLVSGIRKRRAWTHVTDA
jgi:hypothetical protein